jgi:hypothetical protein
MFSLQMLGVKVTFLVDVQTPASELMETVFVNVRLPAS